MDKTEAWQKTKAAGSWTAERWSNESDRRKALRSVRKPLVTDYRKALAKAKADDPEGKKASTHRAERELNKAKRAVPDALPLFAAKSALALGAAGYVGLPLVPSRIWLWSAVAVTVAAVGAIVWAVTRRETKPDGPEPTPEERALLGRLAPEHWREHAEGRGLAGTLTALPVLTESGITCAVRLDGTWTAGKLRQAEDHVRSLLGCRTALRMEIKAGTKGGWAAITLRTRSAADGDDLLWSPERRSFGVDTVTGDQVTIPLGDRLLIAGMSGAGKSVASRPLLYDASEGPTNALVIIDLKRVEGRLWDHRARVASTPADVVAAVRELVAEQQYRLDILPKGQDTWTPTPEHPRLTVVVDEGAEVITAAKDALEGLETIARMGRAACIDLWWMTQKPTIGDGIPKQIAPQLSTRICLAVSTPTEARTVLGEDAQAKGWTAEDLPKPGVALVRDGKRKPNHIRVRYMDKAVVIALPGRTPWRGGPTPKDSIPDGSPNVVPILRKEVPAPRPELLGSDAKVMDAVLAGAVRQTDIVAASGLPKGTVSKVVRRLIEAGLIVRQADGALAAAVAEGVSA